MAKPYQDRLEELERATEPDVDVRVDLSRCAIERVSHSQEGIWPNGEKFPVIGSRGRDGLVGFKQPCPGVPPVYHAVYVVVIPWGRWTDRRAP